MGLSNAERETIINMNNAEAVAYIYTAQPKVITKLKKNPAATLVEEGSFEHSRWARFSIPARLVSFRSATVRPEMTDERKRQARDNLARINAAREPREGLQDGEGVDAEIVGANSGG